MRYPLEIALRASDGNETRRIRRLDRREYDEQCSTNIFDLRARVFYESVKPGILAISKITPRILTMREVARKSLLILSFFLSASKISVTFEKLGNVQRRGRTLNIFDRPKFVDIGRIREVPARY